MASREDGPATGPPWLHINTPLVESTPLSLLARRPVYLKMETAQPTASFKIRGVGHLCQKVKAVKRGCRHLVCSSGGNAGLAAAYSARKLGVRATIYVPSSTPQFMQDILRREGATVCEVGRVWDDANAKALEASHEESTTFVHPFDNADIWEGHSTIVAELAEALPCKPGAIVVSVGGGGLLNGIILGLKKVGWSDVPVVAMETEGADCFHKAVEAGHPVTLHDITSIAKTLGAKTVSLQSLQLAKQHVVLSTIVNDAAAVSACNKFADDHRVLVEPSCGATLASVYNGVLDALLREERLQLDKEDAIVLIVCGGAGVSLELLRQWTADVKTKYG